MRDPCVCVGEGPLRVRRTCLFIIVGAGFSTTPAPNTRKNSVSACVDWVSCSFQFASDLQKKYIENM